MTPAVLTVIGGIVVGILALISARWVARIQAKSSPYAALADRVVALERSDSDKAKQIARLEADLRAKTQRIELLEGDFDVLIPELVVWDQWVQTGAAPPPPVISEAARKVMAHHRKRRARLIRADPSGDYLEPGPD